MATGPNVFALEQAVRAAFPNTTFTKDTCVQVRVDDVHDVSWEIMDRALRKALGRIKSPGVMAVVLDGARVVIYEAFVLWSRREDITRLTGDQEKAARRERHEKPLEQAEYGVYIRDPHDPYIGVRPTGHRWLAVASFIARPDQQHPEGVRHIFSVGTAATQADAARMRDIYVLGLWLDKRITRKPVLNYDPGQYLELIET